MSSTLVDTKICLVCKKLFPRPRHTGSKIWAKRIVCSVACRHKSRIGKPCPQPLGKPLEDRFWSKVTKSDGCWAWNGATHPAGYGLLGKGNRTNELIRATHVSWKIHTGEDVPKGMVIMHTCDNPPCCNPDHLRLGTHRDNAHDMIAKGRQRHVPALGKANGKGILDEIDVAALRNDAKDAPKRRYGRVAFWEQLAVKYNIRPRYAQQLCMQITRYRPIRKAI